jgi:hypothetical protein
MGAHCTRQRGTRVVTHVSLLPRQLCAHVPRRQVCNLEEMAQVAALADDLVRSGKPIKCVRARVRACVGH